MHRTTGHPQASPVLAFFACGRRGRAGAAWAVLAALLCACTAPTTTMKAQPAPPLHALPGGFTEHRWPAAHGQTVQVLERAERAAPLRYRVIVIPGSGCAGMGAVAERYFAGLLHAQVLVLHKPGVAPWARTAPGDCAPDFVQADALSTWAAHARAALRADAARHPGGPQVPQWLVGISEGGELLPTLAPEVPRLAGLVLLASSGLDPLEAGTLQARRQGALAPWQAVGRAQASARADTAVVQGRSLRYWRDLWHWPLAAPLIAGPWPLLQVWGADDELVPAVAYERFAAQAASRSAPYCPRSLPGADHGLQRPGHDGVQQVWGWLEQWARRPQAGPCAEGETP